MKSKQSTYIRYKITDLVLFTALFTISEAIVTSASKTWFPAQPYAFSLSVLFLSLILMRWGLAAVFPAIAGAIAFCLASGAGFTQYIVYTAGNIFAVTASFFLKTVGKEKVRKDALRSGIFVILVFLLQQAGRWIAALAFGEAPGVIITFLTTDSLSALFALIAVTALRHVDGLYEDQKSYLFRLERERKEESNNRL